MVGEEGKEKKTHLGCDHVHGGEVDDCKREEEGGEGGGEGGEGGRELRRRRRRVLWGWW